MNDLFYPSTIKVKGSPLTRQLYIQCRNAIQIVNGSSVENIFHFQLPDITTLFSHSQIISESGIRAEIR